MGCRRGGRGPHSRAARRCPRYPTETSMAVVVTARPPIEAQTPELALARKIRERSVLRWLTLAVAVWYGLSLVAELLRSVVDVTAVVVFAVGVTGAIVRAVGASWACRGTFPDCNGLGALPFGRDPLADVQLYHRLLSYVALALVVWVTAEAFRS